MAKHTLEGLPVVNLDTIERYAVDKASEKKASPYSDMETLVSENPELAMYLRNIEIPTALLVHSQTNYGGDPNLLELTIEVAIEEAFLNCYHLLRDQAIANQHKEN